MPSLNRVLFIGHMTRDPQLKQLPSNTSVCEFGLATNRRFKTAAGEEREEVTFIDCAAFGRTGEVIQQYCTKGKPLFVEGRLKYDSWDDKTGGGKRSKISVVVENFQFLGSREGGGDDREHADIEPYPKNRQSIAAGKKTQMTELLDRDPELDPPPF